MTNTTAPSPERTALLARIQPADQIPGPAKFLIYGPKGSGKTSFCARAHNCLVLDTESGRRSLLNDPELRKVMVLPVRNWNDLDDIAQAHRDGDLSYETWIIDTTDKLANDLASMLLDKAYVASGGKRDRWFVSQAEYRVRNELFRRLTAEWLDLGVNLIFTAHQTEVKDESDGRLYIRPNLSDAMAESFGGYVELQGYLTVEEGETENEDVRLLQVHPTRRVDAKTRIGGLTRILRNPDINDLIAAHYNADATVVTDQTKETEQQ